MNTYIDSLINEFKKVANSLIAKGQIAYMKYNFDFYGIKFPIRKKIQKPFIAKSAIPPKNELTVVIKNLWKEPSRECQFFAKELL